MKLIKTLCVFLGLVVTAYSSFGQQLIVENVTIISPQEDEPLVNRDVYFVDGTIEEVVKHRKRKSKESDYQLIDGSGKYLLPGYADAHVHLPDSSFLEDFFLMNLINGVTTLRSMRGEEWHLNISQEGLVPQLILGSKPMDQNTPIDSVDILVSHYKNAGFDFVKVLEVADSAVFEELVKAAKKHKIPLAGHVPKRIGMKKVAASGVYQSAEHLGGMENLDEMMFGMRAQQSINANIYHCPTLDYYYSFYDTPSQMYKREGIHFLPKRWITEWETHFKQVAAEQKKEQQDRFRDQIGTYIQNRMEVVKKLHEQGAKLLVSPDASGYYGVPGYRYGNELAHYAEAGLTAKVILNMACYNLFEMLGQTKERGDVKTGMKSDLILLNSNPLDDISTATDVDAIILRGEYIKTEELKKKLTR